MHTSESCLSEALASCYRELAGSNTHSRPASFGKGAHRRLAASFALSTGRLAVYPGQLLGNIRQVMEIA